MSKMSMLGLADLVRALATSKSKKEEDGVAKMLGYERKVDDDEEEEDEVIGGDAMMEPSEGRIV